MNKSFARATLVALSMFALTGCSKGSFHEDAALRLENGNPPDLPGALVEFKQAGDADKTSVQLRTEWAECAIKNKDFKTAIDVAKEATALDARNGKAHMLLAEAFEGNNNLNEALTEYNDAFTCDATLLDAAIGAGRVFEAKGDNASAADKYRLAIKTDPNSAPAHEALAQVLSKLGDMANAEAEVKEATRIKAAPPPKPKS